MVASSARGLARPAVAAVLAPMAGSMELAAAVETSAAAEGRVPMEAAVAFPPPPVRSHLFPAVTLPEGREGTLPAASVEGVGPTVVPVASVLQAAPSAAPGGPPV